MIEGLARIAELICRHAVLEALYLQDTSKASEELERAVIKLYACVLRYLSKAKQYFEQGTASIQTLSLGLYAITDVPIRADNEEHCPG